MTLQILLILSLHAALATSLREVSGYLGDKVTLPSAADASWKLSSITWSIFPNNTWIATCRDQKTNVERVDRYKRRLRLNTSTGDLTILHLTPEDDMVYTVDLTNTDKQYSVNKMKVTVRERLQKPIISSYLSKDEHCSWFLQCCSTDADVHLSWQDVPQTGTFSNMTTSNGNSADLSAFLQNTTNLVEITCTSRRKAEKASRVVTLMCYAEEPQPTLDPQVLPSTRERYSLVLLVGSILGASLTVSGLYIAMCVRRKRNI
ncbi:uncharacterized protein si:cabz01074946.1 [Cyclopterus lumpus]|uniref:Immunoglobulin domain-containing protein n=1 Tax=Cyclopterus lumpus TaxID=8103 RepID=A0A8C2Z3B8_CYCLU|nr:uncharacterized protein si:cabz01074946.1 [Cyclopterus lumpus]